MKTLKKVRKGKKGGMEELENNLNNRNKNDGKKNSKNRRAEYKNKKFGFGGKKKNSKKNTAESSADVFDKKPQKWQRPSFHAQKNKKVSQTKLEFIVTPKSSSFLSV